MSPERFDHLLSLIEKRITRNGHSRPPVSAAERLTITLCFLATGSSQASLSLRFGRGHSTISGILADTCAAIWEVLSPTYVQCPTEKSDWEKVASEFWEKWQFPNCLGAIDGKHFELICPKLSGSLYFNYKRYFSTVMLATCDANYKFTMIEIGSYGRDSDSGIFARSGFQDAIESDSLHIPEPRKLPGTEIKAPFAFIGDDAFPLRSYMLRPYPGRSTSILPYKQRVFNYRLSRARRIIENSFGILSARWRLFHTPINANIDNAVQYIQAAVCLHNYLLTEEPSSGSGRIYAPDDFVDRELIDGTVSPGQWRSELTQVTGIRDIGRISSNMSSIAVRGLQNQLADFLVSPSGSVPWQNRMVYKL